ncbi:uncharacterized protein METZ01_LOCUS7954 [marine metagenome]|uniref:HTH cro/C1-type domain-containing protein n=1 Tax=marine metagenome TaxID=408172 RepID=A0A381NKN7_9ZZZZ
MATIRNAYEKKLEETHIESFASYTLIPEEETEVLLLQFSQAFVTLANPIARAKYDDELHQQTISAETRTANGKDSLQKVKKIHSSGPKWQEKKGRWESWLAKPQKKPEEKAAKNKTETAKSVPKDVAEQSHENKIKTAKSVPKDVAGQTQKERQDYYINLAEKNVQSEESLEKYYSTLRAHGGKVSFNGAVLQQIRKIKSITLDELAKITCIRSSYLKAIEDENFNIFTSEIYLKGYLLCYVEAMNLPVEQILEEYISLYKNSLESKKG